MWDRLWNFLSDKPWAVLLVLIGIYAAYFALLSVVDVKPGGAEDAGQCGSGRMTWEC